MFLTFSPTQSKSNFSQGFTLVEMLITLAIISLIIGVMLIRHGAFNSATLLKNQTFEIALDIREAQIFAISARGNNAEFREEYGIHFNIDSPGEYLFFVDDGSTTPPRYNSGEEINPVRLLDDRFEIIALCVDVDTSENCDIDWLDVSFGRPNFDAGIRYSPPSGVQTTQSARIDIAAKNDITFVRSIYVTATGQINVGYNES
ncbi:hypothetical protein CL653_01645 [bacterium]|nr:hypothetical protein [bacterium]